MKHRDASQGRWRILALIGLTHCAGPHGPTPPAACPFVPMASGPNTLDLVLMIENTGSSRVNQEIFLPQLGPLIDSLAHPPCTSPANPTAHACDAANTADIPVATAVHDLHLGVLSPDLGTPGSVVPACVNGMVGDDGLLNPIRYGGALRMHEPGYADPSFPRPADCTDPNQYPSFISFTSGTTSEAAFTHDAQCNAGLYVYGCGVSSQLEAVYRALITHGDAPGGDGQNSGFLRADALLAILLVTDHEDGSVRNCHYANGDPCVDALDVYNSGSTAWASPNLRMRFYMYPRPGDATDPTWPVDRYIDPSQPRRGFMSLKPGHPERIVFGAITGVPLDAPTVSTQGETHVDWDVLLGPPGAGGPNDFAGRQSAQAYAQSSPEGPVSMRLANSDPDCAPDTRVVPACRRRGQHPVPGDCTTAAQYSASPARRIVEVARRFDEATWCPNGRCGNGMVTSICENDDGAAIAQFVDRVRSRLAPACSGALPVVSGMQGGRTADTVSCTLEVSASMGAPDSCDPAVGASDPVDPTTGVPTRTIDPTTHTRVCAVRQLAVDPMTHGPIDATGTGWFYDTTPTRTCAQQITFQGGSAPGAGAVTQLKCTTPCGADGGLDGG